ncbi:hypothetical protein Pmani_028945 [Petrolisthes manimaculis]|uniref:Uncharacterized protein n=1 Tax=Petrolisthes manimaculis TaxID=1843537 RepID=A0AAE1TXG8_9EUCA|nr:hypothetical protein Pmani_028945 [Petrolisthes manimaculis]
MIYTCDQKRLIRTEKNKTDPKELTQPNIIDQTGRNGSIRNVACRRQMYRLRQLKEKPSIADIAILPNVIR